MNPETCWHCGGADLLCSCAFCGRFDPPDWERSIPGCRWRPGPCSFCRNRRNFEPMRERLDAAGIDPRENRWWTFDDDGKKLFDPFSERRRAADAGIDKPSTAARTRSRDDPGPQASDFFAMVEPEAISSPNPPKRQKRSTGNKK